MTTPPFAVLHVKRSSLKPPLPSIFLPTIGIPFHPPPLKFLVRAQDLVQSDLFRKLWKTDTPDPTIFSATRAFPRSVPYATFFLFSFFAILFCRASRLGRFFRETAPSQTIPSWPFFYDRKPFLPLPRSRAIPSFPLFLAIVFPVTPPFSNLCSRVKRRVSISVP